MFKFDTFVYFIQLNSDKNIKEEKYRATKVNKTLNTCNYSIENIVDVKKVL